jgi:hypothetical protein
MTLAGPVAFEMRGGGERNHKVFWWENLEKSNNLGYLSIDERTISEWILK